MISNKAVAGGHREHHKQHDGSVHVGEHPVSTFFRVHIDEAPSSRAVLHIVTEPRERQAAEERAQRVHAGDGDVAAARAHASPVQVRVTDREVALDRHGEEQRERRQAEESHREAKVFTRATVFSYGNQSGVERVRGLYERADQTRASQIGDHERGHKHVEQGTSLVLVLLAAALFPSPHLDQQERGRVAQHTRCEHERAGQRARVILHGLRLMTGLVIGVVLPEHNVHSQPFYYY